MVGAPLLLTPSGMAWGLGGLAAAGGGYLLGKGLRETNKPTSGWIENTPLGPAYAVPYTYLTNQAERIQHPGFRNKLFGIGGSFFRDALEHPGAFTAEQAGFIKGIKGFSKLGIKTLGLEKKTGAAFAWGSDFTADVAADAYEMARYTPGGWKEKGAAAAAAVVFNYVIDGPLSFNPSNFNTPTGTSDLKIVIANKEGIAFPKSEQSRTRVMEAISEGKLPVPQNNETIILDGWIGRRFGKQKIKLILKQNNQWSFETETGPIKSVMTSNDKGYTKETYLDGRIIRRQGRCGGR